MMMATFFMITLPFHAARQLPPRAVGNEKSHGARYTMAFVFTLRPYAGCPRACNAAAHTSACNAPVPKSERSASRKPPAGSYFSFILALFSREINAFCARLENGTRNRRARGLFRCFYKGFPAGSALRKKRKLCAAQPGQRLWRRLHLQPRAPRADANRALRLRRDVKHRGVRLFHAQRAAPRRGYSP